MLLHRSSPWMAMSTSNMRKICAYIRIIIHDRISLQFLYVIHEVTSIFHDILTTHIYISVQPPVFPSFLMTQRVVWSDRSRWMWGRGWPWRTSLPIVSATTHMHFDMPTNRITYVQRENSQKLIKSAESVGIDIHPPLHAYLSRHLPPCNWNQ